MIIRNYKFSIVTLIFFPLLVTPFILKTINKKLEPYPAAIFPSAPSKVKINNSQIILTRKKYYGKSISDKNIWVELPHQEFCFPLRLSFCRYLFKTKFGQEKLERKINLPFYKLVLPEKISTPNWVSNKINNKCIMNPPIAKNIIFFSKSLTLSSENIFS